MCFFLAIWCLLSPVTAQAELPGEIRLDPPGQRDFILDKAGLINPADQQEIKRIAERLLAEKAAPLIVVTVESMAQYGGAGMRVETWPL